MTNPILLFLVQGLVLIAGPWLVWRVPLVRAAFPLVVIQILFGIALGPSVLGVLRPDLAAWLFAPGSLAHLSGLAWMAVVFFAFLTGLHVDVAEIRGQGPAFLAVGLCSLVVPGLLGILAGLWMVAGFPAMAGPNATPAVFAAGVGLCIGVTALPVLGFILRELGWLERRLGRLALGYAAVNDLLLWLLIAVLLAWTAAHQPNLAGMAVGGLGWLAAMLLLVKPLLHRILAHICPDAGPDGTMGEPAVILICVLLFGSAAITEWIGLHYIIGAFAAGMVMPKRMAGAIIDTLEPFAVLVLLPFFFTLTGLKVNIDTGMAGLPAVFAVATLTAMAGKILGTALPARLAGESWADSLRLGALMQCKGLMEVIVLTVLLDAGILSGACFSALVLMAVVTTAATKPLTLAVSRLVPARTLPATGKSPIGPPPTLD